MLKSLRTIGTVTAALLFLAFVPQVGSPPAAEFEIVINIAGAEANLECSEGCAWETLSFSCDEASACQATVDEQGVRGIRTPGERDD